MNFHAATDYGSKLFKLGGFLSGENLCCFFCAVTSDATFGVDDKRGF